MNKLKIGTSTTVTHHCIVTCVYVGCCGTNLNFACINIINTLMLWRAYVCIVKHLYTLTSSWPSLESCRNYGLSTIALFIAQCLV